MKITGNAIYTYTKNPDTKFDPCWKTTIQMTDAEAAKLREVGLKPKRNDEGVFEYKFTRLVKKRKGEGDNKPPRVVDAAKEPFEGIVGNGSRVNVQFGIFAWEFKGKKGISADFQALQVLNLVEYEGKASSTDEFDEVDSEDTTNTTTTTSATVDEF